MMRNHDPFIQHHIVTSIGNLFVYITLSSLYAGVMFMLGYRVGVLDMALLGAANFNTWVAITPLIAILVHTTFTSIHGTRMALQLRHPDGGQMSES
jgi:hypothetical protein